MDSGFIKPRYDAGGFVHLPARLQQHPPSGSDLHVVLLVDGFGWRFFEKFQDAPFLRQVLREGSAAQLTSQFPSTTAAHVTTLHTGLPVGAHGIYEWFYYEPEVDAVIAPLLFSFAGAFQRETLRAAGVNPARVFPESRLYRRLREAGVNVTVLQNREYTPSTYSNAMMGGATMVGFRSLAEALGNLQDWIAHAVPPAYLVFYFDRIDAICHEHGPEAPQTEAEILSFLRALEGSFRKPRAARRPRVRFTLTADHGLTATDPQRTLYLNRDPAFAGVARFLQTNRKGERIVPTGAARDFFLHIEETLLDEAHAFLAPRLEGRAEVRRVAELMDDGYFGPVISQAFRARVGNLVILPHGGESVWWYEKDRFEMRFRGNHGGLTPDEMQIPLLTWETG
jgi:hypothetical protein